MWEDIAQYAGLFFGTFVHEGVAIAAGAMLIVERALSPVGVGLALFAGMYAGDLAIYGLGRAARTQAWAQRRVGRQSAARTRDWLERNMLVMIAVSRVVPGVLFPTYAAFGLLGTSFARFAVATAISIAIFMPLLLWAVAEFGAAILPSLGYWTWVISGAALIVLFAVGAWFGRRNGLAPVASGGA